MTLRDCYVSGLAKRYTVVSLASNSVSQVAVGHDVTNQAEAAIRVLDLATINIEFIVVGVEDQSAAGISGSQVVLQHHSSIHVDLVANNGEAVEAQLDLLEVMGTTLGIVQRAVGSQGGLSIGQQVSLLDITHRVIGDVVQEGEDLVVRAGIGHRRANQTMISLGLGVGILNASQIVVQVVGDQRARTLIEGHAHLNTGIHRDIC